GYARQPDAPLVGREAELAALRAAFEEARETSSCRLVSPLADAGVGKSRLVDSFLASVAGEAAVARGRCLPYGRGITFWPLIEVTREAAGIADDDPPAVARAKVASLLPEAEREAVGARVAAAVALSDEQFPIEALFWGVRKLLEALAAQR